MVFTSSSSIDSTSAVDTKTKERYFLSHCNFKYCLPTMVKSFQKLKTADLHVSKEMSTWGSEKLPYLHRVLPSTESEYWLKLSSSLARTEAAYHVSDLSPSIVKLVQEVVKSCYMKSRKTQLTFLYVVGFHLQLVKLHWPDDINRDKKTTVTMSGSNLPLQLRSCQYY